MFLAQATQHWGDEQRVGVVVLIVAAVLLAVLATKKK